MDGSSDHLRIEGVAFNSEGFTDISYPGVHIRYPEVTEHYLDPSKVVWNRSMLIKYRNSRQVIAVLIPVIIRMNIFGYCLLQETPIYILGSRKTIRSI